MKISSRRLSLISFNSMGILNFDSLHGFWHSINILQRQRKISEKLRNKNDDVIVLQEIHTYQYLNLLKKRLNNHPYAAYKPFLFGPRGGLVVFSKYPLSEVKYINFKKRGSLLNSSFVSRLIRNGVLLCKIKAFNIVLLNVHASPNLDHDHKEDNRFEKYIKAQLKQVISIIKNYEDTAAVILAGDLNTAKDAPNYKKFTKDAHVDDLFSRYNTPTQHQYFLPNHKEVKRIDYVMLRDKKKLVKKVNTSEIFTKKEKIKNGSLRYLSDHIGLCVSFDTV